MGNVYWSYRWKNKSILVIIQWWSCLHMGSSGARVHWLCNEIFLIWFSPVLLIAFMIYLFICGLISPKKIWNQIKKISLLHPLKVRPGGRNVSSNSHWIWVFFCFLTPPQTYESLEWWYSFFKPSRGTDVFWAKVKWFVDGAEYNTNSEMLIWMWSSNMADTTYGTKFPFAALPMKWFPNKDLRARANKSVVEAIAWDSTLIHALIAQTSSIIQLTTSTHREDFWVLYVFLKFYLFMY